MDYETKEVSTCCKDSILEMHESKLKRCSKCDRTCETTEVCVHCNGTGQVDIDEVDNNGNVAVCVDTQKCICQLKDDDEPNQDND